MLNNETNVKCEAEFQISNLSFSCLSKKSKDLQNLENNIKIQNINYFKIRDIKDYLRNSTERAIIFKNEKKFNLTDDELKEVLNLAEINPIKVEELNLEANSLTNKCSLTISKFLEKATNLKKINLRKNNLADEGIIKIFTKNNLESRSFLSNLEVLNLGYNNIVYRISQE